MLAAAIAASVLLATALRLSGIGTNPSEVDVSRALSLALAILVFAIPIGTAHLWFIARGLRDRLNAGAEARHRYLELWILVALLVDIAGSSALAGTLLQASSPQPAEPIAAIAVASLVGILAAWWLRTTPPLTARWRSTMARIGMVLLMAAAAFNVANAAGSLGQLLVFDDAGPQRFAPPRSFLERTLWQSLWTAVAALAFWAVALARQWPWRADRDRLALLLAFYGAGVPLLLGSIALEASALIRGAGIRDTVTFWPALAAGLVLVAIHAGLLAADRGRNGRPAIDVDRLLVAIPAVVGLATALLGSSLAWTTFVAHGRLSNLTRSEEAETANALALLVVGAIAYTPSWLALLRFTRGEPGNGARRFALFTIICLALLATVVLGVVTLYNALTAIAGVGVGDAPRTAAEFAIPAALVAAVFASHLWLLLRDQRSARAIELAPAPVDPLVEILEGVRAGRMSVADAAARVRASR